MRRKGLGGIAGALLLASSVLVLTGCSAVPRGAAEAGWMEYLERLGELESQGTGLEPGSEAERQAIEGFQSLLGDYTDPAFRTGIREVYAENVFFNDTLKTLHGVDEVEEHFLGIADALESGTVEFVDLVSDDGDYYFRWLMTVRFNKLGNGKEIRSLGMTHVRFDAEGRVLLHQDFWDSSGAFFEHVPALGWMIRRTKQRL